MHTSPHTHIREMERRSRTSHNVIMSRLTQLECNLNKPHLLQALLVIFSPEEGNYALRAQIWTLRKEVTMLRRTKTATLIPSPRISTVEQDEEPRTARTHP